MIDGRWGLGWVVLGLTGCCFGAGSGGSGTAVEGAEGAAPEAVVLSQVAVASDHACAVTASGTVECWGLNSHGQLGNGTTTASPTTAVVVAGIHDAVEVDVMFMVSCARRRDGTVWCWGRGDSLGTGVAADATTPVQVPGVANAVDLSLGLGATVVTADGDVAGWGTNLLGLLGLPGWIEEVPTPLGIVHHDATVEAIPSGFGGCGRTSTGRGFCWGGVADRVHLPTTGVDAITANLQTCFRANGVWSCTGPNPNGELGVTTQDSTDLIPFPRANVQTLVAAFGATWVLATDGSIDCVGSECDVGFPRPTLTAVQQIDADGDYVCARLAAGVHCWGRITESTADAPSWAWVGGMPIVLSGAEPGPAGPVIPARPVAPAQLVGEVAGHTSPVEMRDLTPPGPADALAVGQVVGAQQGHGPWYEARITELRPDGRVSVLFEDRSRATLDRSRLHVGPFYAVPDGLSRSDLPLIGPTAVAPGTPVLAYESYWFEGRVVSDDGGSRVRVHWLGNPDSADSNVSRTQVRLLPATH